MKLAARHPATIFFVLALLATYVVGIAGYFVLAWLQRAVGTEVGNVNDLLMRCGPSLAGLATAWLAFGRRAAADIVRRIAGLRAPVEVWLAALLLPPALTLAALFLRGHVHGVAGMDVVQVASVFAVQLLLACVLAGLGEELGWRGFLLPVLAARMTRLRASLLVGVAWLAWHGPAYLLFGKGEDDPFLPFAVTMMPLSMVLAWVYYRSRESLLFPILLHGSLNASFYSLQILRPELQGHAGFQPGFDWTLALLWVGSAGAVVALQWKLFRQAESE